MSSELIDTVTSSLDECTFLKDTINDMYPTLVDLPTEIFFKICSFLEIDFVSSVLAAVCKRFKDILNDENLWRYWLYKEIKGKKYPIYDELLCSLDWREECCNISKINNAWKNVNTNAHHFISKTAHVASVDSLLVKYNSELCLSGSRDRSIMVWNLREMVEKNESNEKPGNVINVKPKAEYQNAHDGWIWGLSTPSQTSNVVYSASWDNSVKVWDVSNNFSCIHTFKCPISVVCVACIDDYTAVAGLFSPKLALLDSRSGSKPTGLLHKHNSSVLKVVVKSPGSHTIYTASEDRTIATFDIRKLDVVQRFTFESSEGYLYALNLAGNYDVIPKLLIAGDNYGTLYTIDMDNINSIASYPLWSPGSKSQKITGLSLTAGAIFVCSYDGHLEVINPCEPLNRVANIQHSSKELIALNFEKNVLAASGDSSTVEFWVSS